MKLLSFVRSIDWPSVGRFFSAATAPVVAVVVAYIAIAQYRINRRQYRLALFEKRLALYTDTITLIAVILRSADPNARYLKFCGETRGRELLFGPEVNSFLVELYEKAMKWRVQNVGRIDDAVPEDQAMEWVDEQMSAAKRVFIRYLDFRKP
jgi:hypothetical protein